jgi:hypothetical protein
MPGNSFATKNEWKLPGFRIKKNNGFNSGKIDATKDSVFNGDVSVARSSIFFKRIISRKKKPHRLHTTFLCLPARCRAIRLINQISLILPPVNFSILVHQRRQTFF